MYLRSRRCCSRQVVPTERLHFPLGVGGQTLYLVFFRSTGEDCASASQVRLGPCLAYSVCRRCPR